LSLARRRDETQRRDRPSGGCGLADLLNRRALRRPCQGLAGLLGRLPRLLKVRAGRRRFFTAWMTAATMSLTDTAA